MNGDYRGQLSRANIVIVPTTSSYELEFDRERPHRKRTFWFPLTCICRKSHNTTGFLPRKAVPLQLHTTSDVTAGISQSANKTVTRDDSHSPKNYLMSGGHRAAARDRDEQLLQLNRAAMKACALCMVL